jgi:hypothetical protein
LQAAQTPEAEPFYEEPQHAVGSTQPDPSVIAAIAEQAAAHFPPFALPRSGVIADSGPADGGYSLGPPFDWRNGCRHFSRRLN